MNMIVTFATQSVERPKEYLENDYSKPHTTYSCVFPFLNLVDSDKFAYTEYENEYPRAWYDIRPNGLYLLAPRMIDSASVDFVFTCWKRKTFGNISMKRVRAVLFAANSNGKLFHVFDVCLNDVSPATLKTALSVDYYPGIQEEMSEALEENFRAYKPNDISPLDMALRVTLAKVGVPKDEDAK